jgi:UPF0716 protein FxsA
MMPFRLPFSPAKWLIFVILAAPVLELVAFIAVAVAIGFLPAILAVVGLSVLGTILLRRTGRTPVARVRVEVDRHTVTGFDLRDGGLARMAGAILLIIPGFISSALGLLLLVPAVRSMLGWGLQRIIRPTAQPDPDVVDLQPEDWRPVPEERLTGGDNSRGPAGPHDSGNR